VNDVLKESESIRTVSSNYTRSISPSSIDSTRSLSPKRLSAVSKTSSLNPRSNNAPFNALRAPSSLKSISKDNNFILSRSPNYSNRDWRNSPMRGSNGEPKPSGYYKPPSPENDKPSPIPPSPKPPSPKPPSPIPPSPNPPSIKPPSPKPPSPIPPSPIPDSPSPSSSSYSVVSGGSTANRREKKKAPQQQSKSKISSIRKSTLNIGKDSRLIRNYLISLSGMA
jgi:hypothetical protein